MGRKIGLILSFLTVFLLFSGFNMAAVESNYSHISFVDNEAAVIRANGSENRLVVNLPVVPGDTVTTSANGRCELQFNNGTVVRLDKNSRLQVTTVLAPALTSNWQVTTLHLLQGQIYILPQTYGREVFQVITPTAAVKLSYRTLATIRLDPAGGTSLFSDGGKFAALYGSDGRALKKITIRVNRPQTIGADHALSGSVQKRGRANVV